MRCIPLLSAVAAASLFASAAHAIPTDMPFELPFTNIASSGTGSEIAVDPFAGDFLARFEPIDADAFRLSVSAGPGLSGAGDPHVGAIFVESGGLFRLADEGDLNLGNVGIVAYDPGKKLNLPQGGNLTPVFDADLAFERRTGKGNLYGINAGETFGVRLTYADDVSFADLRAATSSGLVRVGLHVRSIDVEGCSGCSDALATGGFPPPPSLPPITEQPPAVPLPAALPLAATGIAALGLYARRRRAAR